MAVYTMALDNLAASGNPSLVAAANNEMFVLRLRRGRATTSTTITATRTLASRVTGGVTPTSFTPEKHNSRSPTQVNNYYSSWVTNPTFPSARFVMNSGIMQEPDGQWTPPRPWAGLYLLNGEEMVYATSAGTDTEDIGYCAAESPFPLYANRIRRRPTRSGLWHYANYQASYRHKTATGAYDVNRQIWNTWCARVASPVQRVRELIWNNFYAPSGVTNFQTLAVTLTLTPSIQRQINKPMALSVTMTPALQKQVSKTLALGVTFAPALQKQISHVLAVAMTLAAAMQKQVNKTFAVGVTLTPALAHQLVKLVTMALSITLTPVMQRQVAKTLAVSATLAPTIQKQVSKAFALGVTLTANLQKQVSKSLAVGVTLTPSLAKQVVKLVTLAVNMVLAPLIQKQVNKNIAVSMTMTPNLQKQIGKTLAVGVTLTSAVQKQVSKSLAVPVAFGVNVQKQISKTLSTAVTMILGFLTQRSGGPPVQTPGQGEVVRASARSTFAASNRETIRASGRPSFLASARERIRATLRQNVIGKPK